MATIGPIPRSWTVASRSRQVRQDSPGGAGGVDGLLSLPHPLILEDQPLLLLLENADSLPASLLASLTTVLTPPERHSLRQRRPGASRCRHGSGLALARLVLSRLLDEPAVELPIERGPWGKPQLGPGPWPPLQFNLSHSGSLLLLGIHRSLPIGVDLERHRPGLRWQAIARRCLSAETVATLEATPKEQQLQAFTAAWCALEATLKASGRGLAAGAGTDAGGQGAASAGAGPRLFQPWLPPGYSGAVVLSSMPAGGEAIDGRARSSTASGGIHIASP